MSLKSWLSSLFENNREQATIVAPYKVSPSKKKYVKLNEMERANLLTDRFINKMKYRDISKKYGVHQSTAKRMVKKYLSRSN